MQKKIAETKLIIGKVKHYAPSCDHDAVAVQFRYCTIIFIYQSYQLLVFYPASEMNNSEKKEQRPVVKQQSRKHYHNKHYGSERPGFKSTSVQGHANRLSKKFIIPVQIIRFVNFLIRSLGITFKHI